ncbi:MAG TPA: SGNH/GDSL hydrolase family protein [Bradyrhizobium sp.]|nr:SGNH/GDSL hydrolase family protein [Bradyrhizobium sp.]
MAEIQRHCDTHQDIVGFKYPFPHLTRSLKLQRKIKIVAIGSSSTAGEGDIVPYPARLELLLRAGFHDRMIDVLNRGMSGQEAPSELSRFEPDVIGEAPALVIWQVGTNAVFRKEEFNFDDVAGSIATGLGWLASLPADVVLMDLQYATAVVVPDEKKRFAVDMVNRISAAAEKAGVNVFRRFALMQHWNLVDGIAMEDLIRRDDPNHLHMSDWATNCVTQALYEAIINAPPTTA